MSGTGDRMPALITHDFFGRDVYNDLFNLIGGSKDEADAFLLGNQGPDPMFYCVLDFGLRPYSRLAHVMHGEQPTKLIYALKKSLDVLEPQEKAVGRAYALGFLCHYTLDSGMHPFIYFQQYSLCDAGEPGLTREDGSEVHAVIESELDELVLYEKRGETVATFNPSREILRASNEVLRIISKMIVSMAWDTYDEEVPGTMFERSVNCHRLAMAAIYSPTGIKREILGSIEGLFRRHSFIKALTSRPVELTESVFDNHECRPWQNPFTGEVRSIGFWGLYEESLARAEKNIRAFDDRAFDEQTAKSITAGLNFEGQPAEATIVSVRDAAAVAAEAAAEAAKAAEAAAAQAARAADAAQAAGAVADAAEDEPADAETSAGAEVPGGDEPAGAGESA